MRPPANWKRTSQRKPLTARLLLAHDPFQQVRIDVIAPGKVADQKRGNRPSFVFRDILFDRGFYEGAAQDIAVKNRYLGACLGFRHLSPPASRAEALPAPKRPQCLYSVRTT
ncbi:hypothetical protein MES4922_300140 [Mesorhizobium ventifaucium]|uniref:Transposase DDE domain-containing protein n=1 Tax=Mesorhizobium ventifaucium TaxID=666020 RepID=A0ABN8K1L5_9HYPH|nr:hypothetical protein MES4922_300140 [Mesorhizobium ventifaucium]